MNQGQNEPQASSFSGVLNYFLKCGITLKKSDFHAQQTPIYYHYIFVAVESSYCTFFVRPNVECNFLSLKK